MKDITNEEDKTLSLSTAELMDLLAEHSKKQVQEKSKTASLESVDGEEKNMCDKYLNNVSFPENTDTSDEDFNPLGEGWNGDWTPPPVDKIIFDAKMLQSINSHTPQICISS